MESNVTRNKSYIRLYNYSLRYISYSWLAKLGLRQITPTVLSSFCATYGYAVLIALLVYVPARFLPSQDSTTFYLLSIVFIGIGAWIGRFYGGFLTTGFIAIDAFMFLKPVNNLLLVEFVVVSLLISSVIDKALKSKEVTELKNKEKIFAKTLTQLDQEYTRAREEITARDEFLSIASHELKTPLTSMLMKLHDMINNIRNESLANFSVSKLMSVLENAEQQIKLLATMINDLLNVSLITTGHMNLDYQEGDLVKITKQVAQNFSEILKQKKYKIKTEYAPSVIGQWDKARIEQAITNLLSNAIKYGQNKPISITVHNSGSTGKVIIQDQGIGIDHKDQKVLFQRFKRVENTKDYQKGLGVGLYVTDQIIKAHGGTIKVSSSLSKGSTFAIELPLHKIKN